MIITRKLTQTCLIENMSMKTTMVEVTSKPSGTDPCFFELTCGTDGFRGLKRNDPWVLNPKNIMLYINMNQKIHIIFIRFDRLTYGRVKIIIVFDKW